MSRDEGSKGAKLGSIPAPASVPRPSRPPPAALSGSVPPPRSLSSASASTPPESQRKGTLAGVQPKAAPPMGEEEGFDAEKTMVVDPDDAPTADYDPRTNYNPRARGVYQTSESALTSPKIPAAPSTPSFDGETALPEPRPSEMARKRSSRRTVKIPDDQVQHAKATAAAVLERADATEAGPSSEEEPAPDTVARKNDPDPSAHAQEFSDETTEVTTVRPFRIIDIGSEPPPPVTSPLATWPPAADFQETPIEQGWTPAAPGVVVNSPPPPAAPPAPAPVASRPAPAPAVATEPVIRSAQHAATVPDPQTITRALEAASAQRPVVAQAKASPRPPMSSAPEIVVSVRPEDLVELEPEPIGGPPKRPPPPPKVRADAKERESEPRKRAWFDDLFSDEYLRTHDRLDPKNLRREVDFIEESLGVEKHAVVLDLACGFGSHANELAARGYSVVASDLSADMLGVAEHEAEQRSKADPGFSPPKFVREDMRDLSYEEAFDGAYVWSMSFGYFEDDKNLAVLQQLHRALRLGGMLLIDLSNRDYITSRAPSLVWFEGRKCTCMDDMFVDFFSSRLRVKRTAMFEGGSSRELDYSIRLYALHEMGKMLHEAGFKVVEVTGHIAHPGVYFGAESPRMIILAERV